MKKQPEKYKYFKTLFDSFGLAFKNPRLFVPYIAMFLLVLVFALITDWIGRFMQVAILSEGSPSAPIISIISLVISVLLFFIFLVALGGWFFSALNQFMLNKRFSLKSAFKRSASFGIRVFLTSLIIGLGIIILFMLCVVLSQLFLALKLPAVSVMVIAVFIVLFIIYMTAIVQVVPVLVIEDKGTIETIKNMIRFYLKKRIYSLNIFLVTLLFVIIMMLPSLAYSMYLAFSQMPQLLLVEAVKLTPTQSMIYYLLQFPVYLMAVVNSVYICISYKIKKATIKEK